MIFFYNSKEYERRTAAEIVREVARDANGSSHRNDSIRGYLRSALADLADRVHMRELHLGAHLSDETLAFNYLCLLDEHGIGRLRVAPSDKNREGGRLTQ